MNVDKHTPGEWRTEAFDTANGTAESVFAMVEGTPVEIADVSPDFPDGGVANATLISAAPNLLRAALAALRRARLPRDVRGGLERAVKKATRRPAPRRLGKKGGAK